MNKVLIMKLLLLVSCSSGTLEGYEHYYGFNEYKLNGINKIKNFDSYEGKYVSVKKQKDTVRVFINDGNKTGKLIEYINKLDYWFSQEIVTPDSDPTTKNITKKFIYNDTIMVFDYAVVSGDIVAPNLSFITTKDEWSFSGAELKKEGDSGFLILKNYINNKNKYSYCNGLKQAICYKYFYKEVKGDTLFIYENSDSIKYKKGCLNNVKILSELGEYQSNNSESIIDKFYLNNEGELPCE